MCLIYKYRLQNITLMFINCRRECGEVVEAWERIVAATDTELI